MAWVVALVGFLYHALRRDVRFDSLVDRTDLDVPLTCFVFASLLSVFLSLDIVSSLIEFRSLGLMVIFCLFAWRVRTVGQRKTLVRILLLSSGVAALYGWIQLLTGWDLLGHYRPETGRVCGFFGLHLTYGEYLSMVTCTGMGVLLWVNTKRLTRFGDVLLLGLMGSAVLLSGSKGALLSLAVGLGVVFATRGRKALALYAITGILLCVAVDILVSHRLWGNLVTLLQIDAEQKIGPAASNAHRLCMWWTGLWISLEHFLYGVGLHAVERIYPVFRHPLAIEPNQWHLHNNFVHLWVTRGMLGLAAFLYIFLSVFRLGSYRRRAAEEAFDRGLAAGVLGASASFLVTGLTEYSWGDSEVLMLLYLLFGLLASCGRQEDAEKGTQEVLPEDAPEPRRAALEGIGRLSRTLTIFLLVAGLCTAAFLLPPPVRSLRTVVWEGLLGFFLLVLAVGVGSRRADLPAWERQVCGCLVLCVGYLFTLSVWGGKQWVDGAVWVGWVGLAGSVALFFGCCLLLKSYLRRHEPSILVDLAGISALLTGALIALLTHGLLRMAAWTEPLGGPPYLPVLLLTSLSAALYSTARFAYRGDREQRILLAALGFCTLIHVFL
jgi:O-antigen ligase